MRFNTHSYNTCWCVLLCALFVASQACKKHKVTAGVFCLGQERAAQLAAKGFTNIAYGTDTGSLMDLVSGMQKRLHAQQ